MKKRYNIPEVIPMSMADNIKKARLQKGYNQEYVAQMLGVSRQAVSKWESGKSQPDTKNLLALAQLLDASVDQLIGQQPQISTPASAKHRFLRRASNLLLICALLFGCIGFFSGLYSTMLFLPISEGISIGIPLIWYGKSISAIGIKIAEILFLILSILIRITSWAISK